MTEALRHGARALLAQAIEAGVAAFPAAHADLVDEAGRRRPVRDGLLPERAMRTGIGTVPVRQPRVRDRGAGSSSEPIRLTSAILPRYLRRSRSLDELLPRLYLKGVSTGDLGEALAALLGPDAPGLLSASTINRLKEHPRDGPATDDPNQGLPVTPHGAGDGLPAAPERATALAPPQWASPARRGGPRRRFVDGERQVQDAA